MKNEIIRLIEIREVKFFEIFQKFLAKKTKLKYRYQLNYFRLLFINFKLLSVNLILLSWGFFEF